MNAKLNEARKLLQAAQYYQVNPSAFIRDKIGDETFDYQDDILESINRNKVTAVRSTHSSGKSFIASRATASFLTNRPNSIVVTTAPTFRQVENVIWREIRGMHSTSKTPLGPKPLTTRWDITENWYAIGVSPRDPTSMQGFHAKGGDILVIVDEGAGVTEQMFEAIDGILTSAGARLLVIGNPTSVSGYFYSMFKNPTVHKIHISCFDTPNFKANNIKTIDDLKRFDPSKPYKIPYNFMLDPAWAYDKIHKWGIESPMFKSRVLGEFPDEDANTLIPLNMIDLASSEERRLLIPKGKPVYGHDIARYGDDSSVIHKRYGDWHTQPKVYKKEGLTQTTGRAVEALRDENGLYFIDITGGLGAGPYDRLVELGWEQVYGLNMSSSAIAKDEFINLRAELAFALRDKFMNGEIAIPDDDDLKAELSDIQYGISSDGRRYIEKKEDIKKRRNGKSPDRFDAMMMSYGQEQQGEAKLEIGTHSIWSD